MPTLFFLYWLVVVLEWVAGLGSTAKTNQLELGMSASEVKNTLGEPSQTQFIADKWVWNYSLHQYWKGFVPYDLFFGKEAQKLDA